jgi:hypothetical protein
LRLPVAVRSVVIRGDEEARQTVRALALEPLRVLPPGQWARALGRRAVKYGAATVFFLDDRSFPELEAFWVGGARSSSVVVQADGTQAVDLLLRNGPTPNHVTVTIAGADTRLDLNPGEERRLSVPMDGSRGAVLLTFDVAGGFRPSAHDLSSRDHRFLGVWVQVESPALRTATPPRSTGPSF